MTKISSTVILVIFIAVLAFVGVFTFIPEFEYGQYGEFHSPANLIQKGAWFTDTVSTTFDVDLDEDVTDAQVKSILNKRLNSIYGFYGSKITVKESSATIVIPEPAHSESTLTADMVLADVIARGEIEILSSTATEYSADSVVVSAEHLKSATTRTLVSGENTYYVAVVKLTKEGKEAAKALSAVSSTMYAVDETLTGYVQYINESTLYFYGNNEADAKVIAGYVNSGILGAEINKTDSVNIQSNGGLILAIALGVLILASWIFFVVRYKALGIVGIIAQAFTFIVGTIFAGLVHLEIFNVFALVGLLVGLGLVSYVSAYTFENIKAYENTTYASAKHKGFANSNKRNLILHGIVLALGIILWVIPTIVTAPLGNVLVYMAVLSFFATMALNRIFAGVVAPHVDTL